MFLIPVLIKLLLTCLHTTAYSGISGTHIQHISACCLNCMFTTVYCDGAVNWNCTLKHWCRIHNHFLSISRNSDIWQPFFWHSQSMHILDPRSTSWTQHQLFTFQIFGLLQRRYTLQWVPSAYCCCQHYTTTQQSHMLEANHQFISKAGQWRWRTVWLRRSCWAMMFGLCPRSPSTTTPYLQTIQYSIISHSSLPVSPITWTNEQPFYDPLIQDNPSEPVLSQRIFTSQMSFLPLNL